ncbi:MAG TPA: hypothetical protein VGH23_08525 [Rhizomicrobium sp.]|jgi:hypothetical protein
MADARRTSPGEKDEIVGSSGTLAKTLKWASRPVTKDFENEKPWSLCKKVFVVGGGALVLWALIIAAFWFLWHMIGSLAKPI